MTLFNKYNIKQRTLAATIVLVLVLLAITLISLASFSSTQAKLEKVTSQYQPKMLSAMQLTSHFYHSLSVLGNYLIEKDDYNMNIYRKKVEDINLTLSNLVSLTSLNPELDDAEQLARIKHLVDLIIEHNTAMLDLAVNSNKNMPAIGIASQHLEPLTLNMNYTINDLLVLSETNRQPQLVPLIESLRFNWIMLVSEVRNYLAFRKGATIEEVSMYKIGVNQAFVAMWQEEHNFDSEQEDLLEEFKSEFLLYQDYLNQAVEIHASDNWRADRKLMRNDITPTLRKLTVELETLVSKQQLRIQESNLELSEQISSAEKTIRFSIKVALVISIIVIFLSFRNRTLESNIHQHKESERRMRHKAHHDSLTNLANRAFFDDKINELFVVQKRTAKQLKGNDLPPFFGLLYIDLDGFKAVNDNQGHDAGDFILKEVAIRMKSAVRASDIVCRIGGDEFAVLLQGVLKVPIIEKVAENLCKEINVPFEFNGDTLNVSASIGISYSTHPKLSLQENVNKCVDTITKQADEAMYQAKNSGKNQCYLY